MNFPSSLPASRRPLASDVPSLRWGILGTGWIADRFVSTLRANTTQQVVAVGSRSQGSGDAFAARHEIARVRVGREALLSDPEVDVIYVATPHPNHCEDALAAIQAGKHVLIEKPMGLNAAQARQVSEAARAAGVFCAEALWTLFLPKFDVIRQLLDDGVIGEIRAVQADQGEWFAADHRIYDPQLAGGAMMDLGTYPVMFATWLLGRPDRVTALGTRAASGVMGTVSMALGYANGAQAALQTTTEAEIPNVGTIAGDKAMIQLDRKFYMPGSFTVLDRASGQELRWEEPEVLHVGLFHEALEVARCIEQGLTETPIRPLDDTISFLEVMDQVRAEVGDRFVME